MSDENTRRDLQPARDLGERAPSYETVAGDVAAIVAAARDSAARSVNAALTVAYWLIGQRLVEYEQSGQDWAEYGAALIEQIADDLTVRFGRGFSRQNLQYMRQFYLAYPPNRIRQTAADNLAQSTSGDSNRAKEKIVQDSLAAEFLQVTAIQQMDPCLARRPFGLGIIALSNHRTWLLLGLEVLPLAGFLRRRVED